MTVAIPICQQRISPVLDAAARLLVVTRRHGQEVGRREFVLDRQPPEILAGSIADLSVDVLLCGAISQPLLRGLHGRGIRVRSHLCGEVEEILDAFCRRRLGRHDFLMPGCWERATPNPALNALETTENPGPTQPHSRTQHGPCCQRGTRDPLRLPRRKGLRAPDR